MEKLIAWIIAFMVTTAPPGRPQYIPQAKETKEEAVARYESIATDIATVVIQEPSLFRGKEGKAKTASIIMSVIFFESSFRKDVDTGEGSMARGDGGRSACLMQLNIGSGRTLSWNTKKNRIAIPSDPPEEVQKGFNATELLADRKTCILAGLRTLRMAFGACSRLPPKDWLRAYASGSCSKGAEASALRMNLALRWYAQHRPDFKDVDLLPQAPTLIPDTIPVENSPVAMAP
jgi:hypothetical protein